MQERRSLVETYFRQIQDQICAGLTQVDGLPFKEDIWTYEHGFGGGCTRVLEFGNVFEKGGVNFSGLGGKRLPTAALKQGLAADWPFFATGVSLVIHPHNPYVPTVHMNIRYFEAGDAKQHWWFGGGIDLTPYYPRRQDIVSFHSQLKAVCDRFDPSWYATFKKQCDEYFYLPHRQETRGVGGIFFDQLNHNFQAAFAFTTAVGEAFLPAYLPIVEANKDRSYGQRERDFQLYRRGRYVEFNLLYDRGTKFGIDSRGRTESILMSLPNQAHWRYNYQPPPASPEAELQNYLQPQDWL